MDLYGVTEQDESAFDLNPTESRYQNLRYRSRCQIIIDMDIDTDTVFRAVYNTFNLLGDIGGFYGLLFSLASALLSVLNFQKSENLLAQNLFF